MKEFPKIKIEDIPACSIGVVYGKNKLTQWWLRLISGKENVPTHAFFLPFKGQVLTISTEMFTVRGSILKYKNKRVDIISYNLTEKEIAIVRTRAFQAEAKDTFYDWRGYAWFLIKYIPGLNKIKWLKPKKGSNFCSEAMVRYFKNVKTVSHNDAENSSPLDLVLYGVDTNQQVNTVSFL